MSVVPGRPRNVLLTVVRLFLVTSMALVAVPAQAQSESRSVSQSIDDEEHTHFRYGHYSWETAGGNTIEFTLQNAFRRNGYSCVDPGTLGTVACPTADGFPGVGDVFSEFIGGTRFFPGDGAVIGSPLGPLLYVVTSIDPTNNWLFALALDPTNLPAVDTTINHTYSATGDYLAFTDSCCRISAVSGVNAHINNPDGGYRVETRVNVGTGNNSPVTALPPIVVCPIGEVCTFLVPGVDPDGDPLNFRLSTSLEASSGGFVQPGPPFASNAATVNALGLYTWDTTAATLGPAGTNTLYSTQVTIEDLNGTGAVKSKVAIDFFIQLIPCPPEGCDPPVFPPPPAGTPPVCETTQVVNVGGTLTFEVTASDPDVGDTVTLNVAGLPPGATMNPPLPASGNPIASEFFWTPTPADVGTVVVNFVATSPDGSTLCPVTVEVAPAPDAEPVTGSRFVEGGHVEFEVVRDRWGALLTTLTVTDLSADDGDCVYVKVKLLVKGVFPDGIDGPDRVAEACDGNSVTLIRRRVTPIYDFGLSAGSEITHIEVKVCREVLTKDPCRKIKVELDQHTPQATEEELKAIDAIMALPLDDFIAIKDCPSPCQDENAGPAPYDWRDNGCSGPHVPVFTEFFRQACARHDFGYRNYGVPDGKLVFGGEGWMDATDGRRLLIDQDLRGEMNSACIAAFPFPYPGFVSDCLGASLGFYGFLRNFGSPFFFGEAGG